MSEIPRSYSTDNRYIDDILHGIVGLFEMTFPNRIRGYYLCGSYIDGSAVPLLSDLDVCIVFKGELSDSEREQFQQMLSHLRLIRPMLLALESYSEASLFRHGAVVLKHASRLIYGEDIRPKIPEQPVAEFVREVIQEFYFFVTWKRPHQKVLTFPLSYPDAAGEFYGYDHTKQSPFALTDIHTTQSWAALVCLITTGLICLKSGAVVWEKRRCALAYKTYINDTWTEFIKAVCWVCFDKWKYRIPDDSAGKQQIRELCEKTLAFENHFLTIVKDWLLSELKALDDTHKQQAVQKLGKITYPDKNVLAALQNLENHDNPELQKDVEVVVLYMELERFSTMNIRFALTRRCSVSRLRNVLQPEIRATL